MRVTVNTALSLGAAVSLAVTSGCVALAAGAAGAAVGAGAYAYYQGEMTTTFEAPLPQVWAATQQAVQDLEFAIESESRDALHGRMNTLQADGTRVRIRLDRRNDTETDVRIRVGIFGDEGRSRVIMERIRKNLESR